MGCSEQGFCGGHAMGLARADVCICGVQQVPQCIAFEQLKQNQAAPNATGLRLHIVCWLGWAVVFDLSPRGGAHCGYAGEGCTHAATLSSFIPAVPPFPAPHPWRPRALPLPPLISLQPIPSDVPTLRARAAHFMALSGWFSSPASRLEFTPAFWAPLHKA